MNLNYENLGLIGRGAFGSVFKAVDNENDRMVALKQVRISRTAESGIPCSTLREIAWLRHLEVIAHPNIVRLFDVFQTTSPAASLNHIKETFLTLVFEYVDQDLASFLQKYPKPGLSEEHIKDIMKQLLDGISFLHSHRLVHRDLKPQNILITRNRQIKIADFGLSRVYNFCVALTSVVVTLWYRSPEVLLQSQYGMAVDLWSAGCIFAELYLRRALFPGQSEVDQLHKIFNVIGTPEKEQWPEGVHLPWSSFEGYPSVDFVRVVPGICPDALALLKDMLLFDASQRATATELLNHKFFCNKDDASRDSSASIASNSTDLSNDSGLETDLQNVIENEGLPRKRARLMVDDVSKCGLDIFDEPGSGGSKTGHDVACQADDKEVISNLPDCIENNTVKLIKPSPDTDGSETDESFCNISLSSTL